MAREIWSHHDAAATGFDDRSCRQPLAGGAVISALAVDVRTQVLQKGLWSELFENDNKIHALEAGKQFGTICSRHKRPAGSFESGHTLVIIDSDDKHIAQSLRSLQAANMSDVQHVKATIGRDNAQSLL